MPTAEVTFSNENLRYLAVNGLNNHWIYKVHMTFLVCAFYGNFPFYAL